MQPYLKAAGGWKRLLAANSCHYFVKMLPYDSRQLRAN